MSKFDLRDISDRLTRSRDTEAVVYEFLGYLQSMRADWRASLAFYEVSADSLVNVYERQGNRLVRRNITVPVDQLPARLVRKFFHPSAFFNHSDRRSMLTHLFGGSPSYEPNPAEAGALWPLTALQNWQSCVCVPLADQEDMLALLVLASEKKGAFGSKAIGEIIPVKSMAAMALSQHLYRSTLSREPAPEEPAAAPTQPPAAAEFQERLQRLSAQALELEQDNRAKDEQLEVLATELQALDQNSSGYKQELQRVKDNLFALEEQTAAATEHLTVAYSELDSAQWRLSELQRTVSFMKEVFLVLAEEHDHDTFPRTMVAWFCEHFGVERSTLMLLDDAGETLRISAHRGMDPTVAASVRVRIGQGIVGWVAHNRKPLFVRVREDAGNVIHTHQDAYNSDSFICMPLVYDNRLCGVLNLSNKRDGEPFDEMDLDRAQIAASLLAMTLGGQDLARRALAWAS